MRGTRGVAAAAFAIIATAACSATTEYEPIPGWTWWAPSLNTTRVTDVGGSGPNDVWAADGSPSLYHWNGAVWSTVNTGMTDEFTRVWASAADDVWALGSRLIHWDGASWTEPNPDLGNPSGLWGSSRIDVWVVADSLLNHFDGSAWTFIKQGPGAMALTGDGWSASPTQSWGAADQLDGDNCGIEQWNGTAWQFSQTNACYSSLWGSGPDDVWAVGSGGAVIHWDGTAWKPSPAGTDAYLVGVSGSGPEDVWAVGATDDEQGLILHWDGKLWSQTVSARANELRAIWVAADGEVWIAAGSGQVLHRASQSGK